MSPKWRRRLRRGLYGLTFLLNCAVLQACGGERPAPGIAEIAGTTMGTTYRVQIYHPERPGLFARLRGEIDAILEAVDRKMSTYRPDSEVSRFNRRVSTHWMSISPDTHAVIAEAQRIADLSGGAFDVTVGPLVELWGFGAQSRRKRPPSDREVELMRDHIGFSKLKLQREPAAIRTDQENLQIDLSALAKGFAIDQLARHLAQSGVESFLVEIGGELRGQGRSHRGEPWVVAIEPPTWQQVLPGSVAKRSAELDLLVRLENRSIATSGDYRNFFEQDGVKYSHVIDPRSGRPIANGLASVTVVDGSAMTADAWATALLVLGSERGRELARESRLAAVFILRDGERLVRWNTPEFQEFVIRRGVPE